MAEDFDTWLTGKLTSLSLDEEVYADYLKSVLEETEDKEELKESLSDILSGVLESNVPEVTDEIIKAWESQNAVENTVTVTAVPAQQHDDNIKALIGEQSRQEQLKFANKKSKNVDHELKSKLIAQYGEVSDGEETDESSDDEKPPSEFVNVNAQAVIEKTQQEREKAKKEYEEKKQQDKVNLAKDKLKKEERKDKEKSRTQKGERRGR